MNPSGFLVTTQNYLVGCRLIDSFDRIAGSIVIEYDKSSLFGVYALVRLHLLEATVVIFLLAALLVFVVIRFGLIDVTNVIKLIHGYSSGKPQLLEQVGSGSMTQNFAEQIKQSERMKIYVSGELEKIELEKSQASKSTPPTARQDAPHATHHQGVKS